jgi:hypothetical protein
MESVAFTCKVKPFSPTTLILSKLRYFLAYSLFLAKSLDLDLIDLSAGLSSESADLSEALKSLNKLPALAAEYDLLNTLSFFTAFGLNMSKRAI